MYDLGGAGVNPTSTTAAGAVGWAGPKGVGGGGDNLVCVLPW